MSNTGRPVDNSGQVRAIKSPYTDQTPFALNQNRIVL